MRECRVLVGYAWDQEPFIDRAYLLAGGHKVEDHAGRKIHQNEPSERVLNIVSVASVSLRAHLHFENSGTVPRDRKRASRSVQLFGVVEHVD